MNDPSPVLKQFDYRPRRWQTVALFLLALAGGLVLTYFAITTDGPVDFRGFQLTQRQARILFGVVAALMPFGLICLGGMVYVDFAYDRRVALTGDHLILPRPTRMGFSRDEIQIPFDAISLVTIHTFIGSTKLLRLDHTGGAVSIPSNMLRTRAEFDELCAAVQEAVDNADDDRPT